MNKAIRTFFILGVITLIFYAIALYNHSDIKDMALLFAGGFFMVALGIRLLGYMIKRDRLRKARY